jgi:hypothetical protein
LKKHRDIIINYDVAEDYYVRTLIKRSPVLMITVYVYRKELLDRERVAKINIILLPLVPKILGNEIEGLERGAYERVR